MGTISGTYTTTVTLNPGAPHVVVTGTIDAYGLVGAYTVPVHAAVFGPRGTNFNLHNERLIESNGTSANDAGIVLGGTVLNGGTVIGGSGIFQFGTNGLVRNTRLVEGSLGAGILLTAYGTVINTGIISGATAGIALIAGGYVDNGGNIFGDSGIAGAGSAASYIYNTGNILATTGDGISLTGDDIVSNTGGITAGVAGVALADGGIAYNYGIIQGGKDGILLQSGGTVHNAKRIKGAYGIYAASPADIYNTASGLIAGQTIGVSLKAGGIIENAGTITGMLAGIALSAGTIDNAATGVITASTIALTGMTGPVTVYNAGYIHDTVTYSNGFEPGAIILLGGGSVDNTGTIDAYGYGVFITGGAASLTNSGYISADYGRYAPAVDLNTFGTITNTGTLAGAIGVVLNAGGLIDNAGTIFGSTDLTGGTLRNSGLLDGGNNPPNGPQFDTRTVYVEDGGIVLNSGTIRATFGNAVVAKSGTTITNTGLITSYFYSKMFQGGTAISLSSGAKLINDGTILGGGDAISIVDGGTVINDGIISHDVSFGTGAGNLMVMAPTAEIIGGGTLYGGGGTLELAAGTKTGTVTPFASFSTILIDPGATWNFKGNTRLGSGIAITNNGSIIEFAGEHLGIAGPLTGMGTIDMGVKGLDLDGPVGAGQKIRFTGLGETLNLGDATAFAGTIGGFTTGETIVLQGISKRDITAFAFAAGTLTIAAVSETIDIAFSNAASFGTGIFHDFKDGSGIGITLSGAAAMNFLPPPEPAKTPTQFIAIKPPAAAPPPASAAVQPAATLISTGSWAPHWPSTPAFTPPAVTLQT